RIRRFPQALRVTPFGTRNAATAMARTGISERSRDGRLPMKIDIGSARAAVSQPSIGYDLLRIYLGVALFVAHPGKIVELVKQSGDWFWPFLIAHYVGMAHLGAVLLLAVGLVTR